jgi:hypothetical protein
VKSYAGGVAAVSLLALLFVSAPAAANHQQETIFDPPGRQVVQNSPERRDQILDQVKALGTDTVRLDAEWRSYAPRPDRAAKPAGFDGSDPDAYPQGKWDDLDAAVRGATSRGLTVLLTPDAPAPRWATAGGESGLKRPDPHEFGQFVEALGRRYSGACACGRDGTVLPRVSFWSVWNEPNLWIFLRPQLVRGRSVSWSIYRPMFLAAQRALEASGHGSDRLLFGELGPNRGSKSTTPLAFLRQVLCLDRHRRRRPRCAPIDAAGVSVHPYIHFYTPWGSAPPGHISIGTMGRLQHVLRLAARTGATTHRLPVYVTEFGVESFPDPLSQGGVSQRVQAEYIAISEYLLYEDPWVRSYSQYLLYDDALPELHLSFQSGLREADGTPKLAWYSFPMTIVARQRGGQVLLWGHLRPGSGSEPVQLEYRDADGVPHPLGLVYTDLDGYFSFWAPYRDGGSWRATGTASDGRIFQGIWIRSYRF